ncbi:early endosome antigen 1-like isoform X1 [Channa argus]|uniref:early endosome antigen 1-like isoform X1 n=1 Tax=Channa argus TaxID=215402 RepID=UPI003520BB2C
MSGAEDCSLSITKESDSLDPGGQSKMFRHSRCPFSLTDHNMWDTKSRFTAQSTAWCGMATLSGTGFQSRSSTSTCGLRQNDPGLRRQQSLSHLAPEGAAGPFPSSLWSELQATHGERSFRQSEMVQWLQDAHEHLDTQLDRLRTRDAQLGYRITTAQLSDMKHKQLSEVMSNLKQEREGTKSSEFEKSQQCRQSNEKVHTFEKDWLQMRTTLDRGSDDEPPERAKIQQVEQNQILRQVQSSAETQKMLLDQIEKLNQRLGDRLQNHSEMQEQLTEANNKISQTCLEKAILSTQVLKLEDNIKDLKAKLTEALSNKDELIQKSDQVLGLQLDRTQPGSEGVELHDHAQPHSNKQDKETVLMKEEPKALKEIKENLESELETIKQRMEMLQCELQELTAERINTSKHITDLEADKAQLIREKEELLSKMNTECETKEKCCQLSESMDLLQLDKQKLQDQCLYLEAKLLDKEKTFLLQEEEYQKQHAVRVQTMEQLKAMVSHWTEKWQKVALTLQTTQEELKDLKKNNSRNELQLEAGHLASEIEKLKEKSQKDKEQIDNLLQQNASMGKQLTDNKSESELLLRVELDACKQELELERSRSQMLLQRCKDKGAEAVQSQDKGTVTDLSNLSLLWVPPAQLHSSQHKSPQVLIQNSDDQQLKKTLAKREKELQEKAEALKTLEKLRETEKTEAQIKISALELKLMKKATEDDQDPEGESKVSTIGSLRGQLEGSRRRVNQLQQEKILAVQKLQTLKQLYPVKDENAMKDMKDNSAYLETDQQRRAVTEQLKNLFKEREEKEKRKVDNTATAAAAAQTGASLTQDWTPNPTVVRTAVNRWNWQPNSSLTPVFEENEEDIELQGKEEGELEEEACAQESIHNQRDQMSAMSTEHISVKAKHENLLQALRFEQPLQVEQDETTAHVEVPNLRDYSNKCDLQQKPYFHYPDGIFLAELVNICSPDEDEEEGGDKLTVS